MEIAKNIDSEYFINLNLKHTNSPDWSKAIEILRCRLYERYIQPADKLIELENHVKPIDKTFGFSLLLIDFALTETLQSFYEGITDSTGKSKQIFINFLTSRENFKEFFDENKAKDFYHNFRCGIMHQTQTTNKAKVWSIRELYFNNGSFWILNRNEYHTRLKKEVDLYLELLLIETNVDLRKNFLIKMAYICTC